MQIDFIDPYPYKNLEPDLRSLMLNARKVDAAVAFVTQPGVALLRQYFKSHPPGSARLVASVRFPTDLVELANLEDDYPGTVFLHTGFQRPVEKNADRGQFHSKVVLLELGGADVCIILGSHNWTGNALHGHNMEAGVILRCQETDPVVAQVRKHIEACAQRSEPFLSKRLRFYRAVQRDLHREVGPGGQESEDFPGFEPSEALVIHAEDCTPNGLPSPVQLFIPVRDGHTGQLFAESPRVLLYVYPPGSLIGEAPPTASPVEHEGTVTMQNVVPDAPVTARAANCRIENLEAPRIELLPAGTVPVPSGETYQVVIRFDPKGSRDLPVFHATNQHPKIRLGVDYQAVDRDEGDEHAQHSREHREEPSPDAAQAPLPEYRAPHHLTVRSLLRIPSQDLYRSDILRLLTYVLMGTDSFDESTVPDLELATPATSRVLNRYVYRVNYRLSEETTARIEKQLRLFPVK